MISPVAPGQAVSAGKLNDLIAAVNRLDPANLAVTPPLIKTTQGGRTQIGLGAVSVPPLVPVRATAANGGSAWTAGTLLAYDSAGALVNATPAETIDLQPLQGTLVANDVYFAADTGKRSSGTNRRRFRTERAGALTSSDPAGTTWQQKTFLTSSACTGDSVTTTAETVWVRA